MAAKVAKRSSKRKLSKLEKKEAREFYLYISPWLIGFLVFFLYPLASSLYYSFTRYEIGTTPHWIGLGNYIDMFTDPRYLNAIKVTFIYALVSVPLLSMVALGLALILSKALRGINIFRSIYFMPSVMPLVAISLTFFYVLRPETGPLEIGRAHV